MAFKSKAVSSMLVRMLKMLVADTMAVIQDHKRSVSHAVSCPFFVCVCVCVDTKMM